MIFSDFQALLGTRGARVQREDMRRLLEPLLRTSRGDALKSLFVLLGSTRDIVSSFTSGGGGGQRRLTYMMLDIWYDVYPVLAVYALEALIVLGHGSWRDVTGLCCYLRNESPRGQDHPFIETAVELSIRKLSGEAGVGRALAAKWVPRETSKKKSWLFTVFVQKWFGCSNLTTEQRRQFRRLVSDWSSSSSSSVHYGWGGLSSDMKTMQQVFDAVVF